MTQITVFPTQNIEGVDLTATYTVSTSTPEYPALPFTVGTRVIASVGSEWIFATAIGTINQYDVCWIDNTFAAVRQISGSVSTTGATGNVGTPGFFGFWQNAQITSGTSGWFMISGKPTINVAGSTSANVNLWTSDTSGLLTSSANTASQAIALGVVLVNNISGSTASSQIAIANMPTVLRKSVSF